MSMTLLKTKLYMPELRPELISRPRLVGRLDEALRSKLTVLSAPAGYGKTTLICQSLSNYRIPVGWVSLDKGDNDPSRFWFYCIQALSTLDENIGRAALELIKSSHSLNLEAIITLIINEVSKLDKEIILVFDDFHVIENESVCESFSFLVNNLPSKVHTVITTRADPPLSLSRLRVQGELTELRAIDLRFNNEETTAFFSESRGYNLTENEIKSLETGTEGWIAGLQLAAFSLKGKKNISDFIEAFSGNNRYVLDYLTEEVLNNLDSNTRSFLLETSILERLTGPLCDAITEREGSQQMLNKLDSLNLFIEPLDEKREWYRYHHLFADLLRSHLIRSKQKPVFLLHLKASEWYEQQGLVNEAIEHALEAGYYPRAIQLVDSVALPTILQSYGSTVLNWLERIPKEITDTQPWLCFYTALAHQFAGNFEAVDEFIKCAENSICQAEKAGQAPECCPDTTKASGYINTVRISKALFQGDIEAAIELGNNTLHYLSEQDLVARAGVLVNLGIAYKISGNFREANQCLEEAVAIGKECGHAYAFLVAAYHMADIELEMGHLHKANEICIDTIKQGRLLGGVQPLPATGFTFIGLSQTQYQMGET